MLKSQLLGAFPAIGVEVGICPVSHTNISDPKSYNPGSKRYIFLSYD